MRPVVVECARHDDLPSHGGTQLGERLRAGGRARSGAAHAIRTLAETLGAYLDDGPSTTSPAGMGKLRAGIAKAGR